MRHIFIILFLIFSLSASATNYHFANAGNDDTGNGSIATPYKTITKLNALWAAGTLAPGDSVCFKAGDTFTGTITVAESGSSGSPIIIGRYWTGDDPVVTGFATLSSWTDEGGGIYSKTVSLESSDYLITTVDNVNTTIGRWPNDSYNAGDSYSGTTSLTDAALTGDWTGADVAVRVNDYLIQRRTISNHTGATLTYSALQFTPVNGYGYFIENHLSTLDATNEWFYDGSKFYIYGNPAAKTVKVSAYNNGVYINSFDYITIDNINFSGYGNSGINLTDASYITVQNCSMSFCGENGILGANETSGNSSYCTFDNNIINQCNNNGINITSQFDNATISNNTISNIGLLIGMANVNSYYNQGNIGICIQPNVSAGEYNTNTVIEYNSIDSVGYHGIYMYADDITVRYNVVTYYCLYKQDGGGVYTYKESAGTLTVYIGYNLVFYGIGNTDGLNGTTKEVMGIYVDGYSNGVTVEYNTVAKSNRYGFFCNGNKDGIVRYNTLYNNPYNMYILKIINADIHENLNIKNNVMLAKAASEESLRYISVYGELAATVSIDSNYYARPVDDDYTIFYYAAPNSYFFTLATWQTYRSDDANSKKSPISVADTADIDLYYSLTDANTIELPYASIDLDGTKYATEVTLDAYESIVLLKDPDPDPDPPDLPTLTTTAVSSIGLTTASSGGTSVTDGDGTISAKGVCWNTTGNPTTADSKTSNGTGTDNFTSSITGLTKNTTYYVRAYATNETGTGYGYILTFKTPKYKILHNGGKVLFHGGKILVID